MKRLDIYFCGWGERWVLGTIAESGRDLLFQYSAAALEKGVELSPRHLKLRADAYGDFPDFQCRLPGLFADCLPDGWGLLLMDRLFRRLGKQPHEVSPLDRLALIGDRAIGAFVFEPAADIRLEPADLQLLDLAREVQKVVSDQESAALKQLVMLGGSPHGARPKALVQYDCANEVVSTLNDAPGTPWLIKFPARSEHKEVCAIEHLYAELARQCGLDMPATRYFDLGRTMAAFGIERFDRRAGLRVPVHTLAGALHADFRLPSASYQTLLRGTRLMTHSEREVQKAFERCVFNVIFNNRDDHAKNFSFRMDESFSWKLAPCYDLTYCAGPAGYHQMDIEGEALHPAKADLLRLANTNSLNPAWASDTIERMIAVASGFQSLAKDYPIRQATQLKIARAIDENCKRML